MSTHPKSALASLVDRGTSYTRAQTPVPSDSFPGMVAQLTGGNPGTTGIYYDDTYNDALLPELHDIGGSLFDHGCYLATVSAPPGRSRCSGM